MEFTHEDFKKAYFEGRIDIVQEFTGGNYYNKGKIKNIIFLKHGQYFKISINVENDGNILNDISIDEDEEFIEVFPEEVKVVVYRDKSGVVRW